MLLWWTTRMEWEKMLDFSQRVSKLLNNKFESFFPNNRLICRGAINIHSCIKFHGWQFQGKTHNNNNKYVVDWQPRHIKRCYPMITCEPSWANICQLSFFPNYIIGTTRAWQWAGSSHHDNGYLCRLGDRQPIDFALYWNWFRRNNNKILYQFSMSNL